MRYAVPLLKAGPLQIPDDHTPCANAKHELEKCVACMARDGLTENDWTLIEFFRRLRDQVLNLTPFGTPKGQRLGLVPDLKNWLAACELYQIPVDDRANIIDECKWLFYQVADTDSKLLREVWSMIRDEIREPTLEVF